MAESARWKTLPELLLGEPGACHPDAELRRLGLSPQEAQAEIDALRADGWTIETSADGCRLLRAPDILSEAMLRQCLPEDRAGRILVLPETDSTNLRLKELALSGAESGTAVLAERQTAGRGRLGRSFYSPAGVGLYLSYLYNPGDAPWKSELLTSLAGEAVCAALERFGVRPMLKWPNDVILGGRKLCGILTTLESDAQGRIAHAVIGIGVNVNGHADDFPEELRGKVVTLAQWGCTVTRAQLAAAILEALDARLLRDRVLCGETSALIARLRELSCTVGRQVKISEPTREWTGLATGIDENGALLVTRIDGSVVTVSHGEASVRGLLGYL